MTVSFDHKKKSTSNKDRTHGETDSPWHISGL